MSTLIVPDKHVQPVCLDTMFFTIDSLINVVSSACVILGGSCTLSIVGCSLLFRSNVAVRFCSVAINRFLSDLFEPLRQGGSPYPYPGIGTIMRFLNAESKHYSHLRAPEQNLGGVVGEILRDLPGVRCW